MSYEMKMTTCELQFGLCFCGIFSVSDMTGCYSVFSSRRSGLFLQSLVCLWNFCRYSLSNLGFLNPSSIDIWGQISLFFLWGLSGAL